MDSGCSMKGKGGHGLCRRNLEDGIGSREGMQESVFDCLENDVRRDSPHADVGGWRGAPVEADAKWSEEGSLVSSPLTNIVGRAELSVSITEVRSV